MVNAINNIQNAPGIIAKMAASMLADKTQFCKSIDKSEISDFDGKNGYNAGQSIQINVPARFTPGNTADITGSIQSIVEQKVTLSLNTLSNVPIALTSAEIQNDLSLKSWAKRVLEPAVSAIAQDVENRFIATATNETYNLVGTAGSTVFNVATILSAKTSMDINLAPIDDKRCLLLNSSATASAVNARSGLFQDASSISAQYKKGVMGISDGFTYKSNELLNVHTNGTMGGTPLVNGAAQTGASLITDTWGATGTITKGTVFTIAGVFTVHPITKVATSTLQQFVVKADATAVLTAATLSISPSIITTGSTQNVSASPANNAVITPVGVASASYTQNLAFHKSAFRMVSVPLVKPNGTDLAAQETVDNITIRVIRDYDVLTDKLIMRLDFLGGIAAVRPEWACRITA